MKLGLGLGVGLGPLLEDESAGASAIVLAFSGTGAAENFNPATLGGGTLVLDLWADKIVGADGAVQATLTDYSGAGNTATNVASPVLKTGILGTKLRPVVRYNGSSQYGTANGVAAAFSGTDKAITVVLVGKITSAGAAAKILAGWFRSSSSTPFFTLQNDSSVWLIDHRNDAAARQFLPLYGASDTNAHVWIWRYTGAARALQVDGVNGATDPAAETPTGAFTSDIFGIAAQLLSGTPAAYSPLDLHRIMVYSSSLSDGDAAIAKTKTAAHVGITVS